MTAKLLILLFFASQVSSMCPTKCSCYLDLKGRNAVQCKEGGMVGPLSLNNIDLNTEIIKITAPDDNLNSLTMSPVFQGYKQLEQIHVTKSNIPQLGMHFFYGLTKLIVLNLSQNNITQPLDHNFRGLTHLEELYLDDNRIISLPSGTFRYLPQLRLLSIQRNSFDELSPRMFLEIGRLKTLKLSGNTLRELSPEVFRDIPELTTLECRGCALTKLNNEIYHLLPHLKNLDIGDNEIKTLPSEELRELTSLRNLKVDGNQITIIQDSTFVHQPLLNKLNLARNQITRISRGAFKDFRNLTELDLSYNKLEKFDFLQPVSDTLEVLILSGNRLKLQAFQVLKNMTSLRELRLAECDFTDIYADIFPSSLSVLDLSRNHLSVLSKEILPLNLQELDLSRNRFRGLSEDVLIFLENTPILKLDNNLWSCDLCYIVPLLDRVNKSVTYRNIVCASPYIVKGRRLEMIRKNELTWCSSPSHSVSDANFFLLGEDGKVGIIAAGTSVFLLVLTVFAIIGALCYSRRHAARYYTHEDKLAREGESIFDDHNQSPLFCDGELNFKFPLDAADKKISIATIDELKKEQTITNGT